MIEFYYYLMHYLVVAVGFSSFCDVIIWIINNYLIFFPSPYPAQGKIILSHSICLSFISKCVFFRFVFLFFRFFFLILQWWEIDYKLKLFIKYNVMYLYIRILNVIRCLGGNRKSWNNMHFVSFFIFSLFFFFFANNFWMPNQSIVLHLLEKEQGKKNTNNFLT